MDSYEIQRVKLDPTQEDTAVEGSAGSTQPAAALVGDTTAAVLTVAGGGGDDDPFAKRILLLLSSEPGWFPEVA